MTQFSHMYTCHFFVHMTHHTQQGGPTMTIGNHELKGTAIILKEPFAVMRKRKASKITSNVDDGPNKLQSQSGVQLEVVGVVKKKLMFDQYPKSIMR